VSGRGALAGPPHAALAALLLAALAGCQDEPGACPGDKQATLSFGGAVASGQTSCDPLIPEGAATSFPATVSFTSDTGAALCLSRLLTEPRACTRAGDLLSGCASPPQEVTLSGCPCAISLQETLGGTLVRSGQRVTGFTGSLLVTLARSTTAAAAACYASGDVAGTTGSCPPAAGCTARYDLSAAP
jgi:hypothetical protein